VSPYAQDTSVAVEKSKAEIERILMRYGCDQFMSGWDQTKATIGFRHKGRFVSIVLALPDRQDKEFTHKQPRATWRPPIARDPADAHKVWEQACRQRWRALALVVKAKLEAVEIGISSFDAEFLAWTMLPDGRSVGEWIAPQLEAAYSSGKMPPMLPGLE